MLTGHAVKSIELGPRQLSFGFDDHESLMMDLVTAGINKGIKTHGEVRLDDTVKIIRQESPDTAEAQILQAVFWLTHEMKFHFRLDQKTLSPFEAKQILSDSPGADIRLTANKPADDSIFLPVRQWCHRWFPSTREYQDQYDVAFALLKELKKQHTRLESFKPISEKPGFPGRIDIENLLRLLNTLLVEQDSYSLIQACFDHLESMTSMVETYQVLFRFYTQDVEFWEQLTSSMEDFSDNQAQLNKLPEASAVLATLSSILMADQPYDFIIKARSLLPLLQQHHDVIEKQKIEKHRSMISGETEQIIKNLSRLFSSHDTDPALRNQCLYTIRRLQKKLSCIPDIREMTQLLNDIKDLTNDLSEELNDPEGQPDIILDEFYDKKIQLLFSST